MYPIIKTILSALIITGVSELSKINRIFSAALISLPIMSIIAFSWIYYEDHDKIALSKMSFEVVELTVLSLPFFLILGTMLKHNCSFVLSMIVASISLIALYSLYVAIKGHFLS